MHVIIKNIKKILKGKHQATGPLSDQPKHLKFEPSCQNLAPGRNTRDDSQHVRLLSVINSKYSNLRFCRLSDISEPTIPHTTRIYWFEDADNSDEQNCDDEAPMLENDEETHLSCKRLQKNEKVRHLILLIAKEDDICVKQASHINQRSVKIRNEKQIRLHRSHLEDGTQEITKYK